jgi:chromosome segregation ATPase
MNNSNVLGIIISVLLSINGITLTLFVTNIRELKKVIQDLSLAIRSSQKDIEYLNKSVEMHEKILERHSEEIEDIKLNAERNKGRTN